MASAQFTLGADVRQFLTALSQARSGFTAMGGALANVQAQARATGVALGSVAAVGTREIGIATKTFAQFEQMMRNVIVVVNETNEVLETMTEKAIEVGKTTQVTATQAANALFEIALAGFSAQESMDTLIPAVSLSIAAQKDIRSTVLLLTSSIRAFGLEATDSARIADLFTNAITQSPATLEKLAAAFRYVGPVAKAYGATIEETVASLELLFLTGLRGEQAGTALRNTFVRLVNPTARARKVVEELGLTVQDINPRIVGLQTALLRLSEAGIAASDATQIFGVRAINAYITLAAAGREGLDKMIDGLKQMGAAERVAEQQLDTFRGSVTLFQSALETARIIVGGFVANALRPLVDFATQVVRAFANLPEPLQRFSLALGVVSTALLATLSGLLLIAPALIGMKDRLAAVNTVLIFMGNLLKPFAALFLATANAVGVLTARLLGLSVSGTISTSLVQLRTTLLSLNLAFLTASKGGITLASTMALLRGAFTALWVALTASPLGPFILAATVLSGLFIILKRDIGGLATGLKSFWESVKSLNGALNELTSAFGSLAGPTLGAIIKLVVSLANTIAITLNPVVHALGFILREASYQIEVLAASLNLLNGLLTREAGSIDTFKNTIAEIKKEATEARFSLVGMTEGSSKEIGKASVATAAWREEFDEIKRTLTGQELVDALTEMLFLHQNNANAVGMIREELERAIQSVEVMASEMEVLTAEAQNAGAAISQQLEDLDISLIEEEELRKLEEARVSFERLNAEIEGLAEKNIQFEPFAESLLAETTRLEQESIAKIEKEAAEARTATAERAYDELENMTLRREQDITSLKAGLSATEVERISAAKDQELAEVKRSYQELEDAAEANAKRIEEIQNEKNAILLRSEETHQENIAQIDTSFEQSVDRWEARFKQLVANAEGDVKKLTEIEQRRNDRLAQLTGERLEAIEEEEARYAEQVATVTDNYGDLEAEAQANTRRMIEIGEQRTEELRLIEETYAKEVTAIYDEISQAIIDRQADIQRQIIASSGSKVQLANFDSQAELQAIDSFYDDLLSRVGDNAEARLSVEKARQDELANAERRHTDELITINNDFYAELSSIRRADQEERIQSSGTGLEKAWLDFENDVNDIKDTFRDLREEYADNMVQLAIITANELGAMIRAWRRYLDERKRINKEFEDAINAGYEGIEATRRDIRGDPFEQETAQYEERLRNHDEFIQEMLAQTRWWQLGRRREINQLANEQELSEAELHQSNMIALEERYRDEVDAIFRSAFDRMNQTDGSQRSQIRADAEEQVRIAQDNADKLKTIYQGNARERERIDRALALELQSIEEARIAAEQSLLDGLVSSIEDNARQISSVRADRQEDEVASLQINLEEQRSRIEKHYDDLISDARGFFDEQENLRAQRSEALTEFDLSADKQVQKLQQQLALDHWSEMYDIYIEGKKLVAGIIAAGTEDVFEVERNAHEIRIREIHAEYQQRIRQAKINGEDTHRLTVNQHLALQLAEEEHNRRMRDLADELVDAMRQRSRARADAEIRDTGTATEIERYEYEQRTEQTREFYREQLRLAESNLILKARIVSSWLKAELSEARQHSRNLIRIEEERARKLRDITLDLAREAAGLTLDPFDDEEATRNINLEAIKRQFDALEEEYRGEDLVEVTKARNQAIENEDRRHVEALREIYRDLLGTVRDFRVQSLQDQVELGTASNPQILELELEERLERIEEFAALREQIAWVSGKTLEEIDQLIADARIAAQDRYNQQVLRGEQDAQDQRVSLVRDTATKLAEISGDERAIALIDFEIEKDRLNRGFDDLIRTYTAAGLALDGIEEERQAALRANYLRWQQELTDIVEAEADRRLRLMELIYRREQAILDLQIQLTGTDVDSARAERDRAFRDLELAWEEIIDLAEEAGEDINEKLRLKAEERTLIERKYVDDVEQIYKDLNDSILDIVSRTENLELGLGWLREPDVLQAQADRQIAVLTEFWQEARDLVESTEGMTPEARTRSLLAIDQMEARAQVAILEDTQRQIIEATKEFDDSISDRRLSVGRTTAERTGNAIFASQLDLEAETRRINRFYDERRDEAIRLGRSLTQVELARQEELAEATAQNEQDITDIIKEEYEKRISYVRRLEDLSLDLERGAATLAGNETLVARLDYDEEILRVNRFYDQMVEEAEGRTNEIAQAELLRQAALTVAFGEFQQGLTAIAQREAEARQDIYDRVRESQERLVDLQLEVSGTDVSRLYNTLQRDLAEVAEIQNEIRDDARENGVIIMDTESRIAEHRKALWDRFLQEVKDIYRNIAETIESELANISQTEIRLGSLTSIEAEEQALARRLDSISEMFDEFREQINSDATLSATARADLLGLAGDAEARLTIAARAEAQERIMQQITEFNAELRDARGEINRLNAELTDDQVRLATLSYEEQVRSTDERFQELYARAVQQGRDTAEVEALWQETRRAQEAAFNDDIQTLKREGLEKNISNLEGALNRMTVAQVDSLRTQAEEWRRLFAEDGEALEAVDGFIDSLQGRLEDVRAELQDSLNITFDLSGRFSAPIPEEAIEGLRELRDTTIDTAQAAFEATGNQADYNESLQEALGYNDQIVEATEHNLALREEEIEKLEEQLAFEAELRDAKLDSVTVNRDVRQAIGQVEESIRSRIAEGRNEIATYGREISAAQAFVRQLALMGTPFREQVEARKAVVEAARENVQAITDEIESLKGLKEGIENTLDGIRPAAIAILDLVRDITGFSPGQQEANLRKSLLQESYEEELGVLKDQNSTIQERLAALQEIRSLQQDGLTLSFAERRELERLGQTAAGSAKEEIENGRDAIQSLDQAIATANERLVNGLQVFNDAMARWTGAAQQANDGTEDSAEGTESFSSALENQQASISGTIAKIAELNTKLGEYVTAANDARDATAEDFDLDAFIERLETAKAAIQKIIDDSSAVSLKVNLNLPSGSEYDRLRAYATTSAETFTDAFNEALDGGQVTIDEVINGIPDETEAMGASAGAGLMGAFADGVTNNSQQLLDAVREALEQVRGLLPSSDAKWGPLSDLTHSGRMLLRTFASGSKKELPSFEKVMARNFDNVIPSAAAGKLAQPQVHPSISGANSPIIGQLNVDGRSTQVPGPLALSARQIAEAAKREIEMQRRMG